MLHRDDHRRQPRREVAVHPVALHRCPHESTAVDMDDQREIRPVTVATAAPSGGPVHPDRERAVGQLQLLPPDHCATVGTPGDHPRHPGRALAVLGVAEGDQLFVRHRQPVRFPSQDVQQPDAQRRPFHTLARRTGPERGHRPATEDSARNGANAVLQATTSSNNPASAAAW